MQRIFTLAIFLLIAFQLSAQERVITGRLVSNDDGSPLPGVNIIVKGTRNGTVSDADGRYSINVPVGAVLVFSFIGMKTQEVVVTESNFNSGAKANQGPKKSKGQRKDKPIPRSLFKDTTTASNTPGVAALTDDTPSYFTKSAINPSEIRSIKRFGKNYWVKMNTDPYKRSGFGIQLSSSMTFESVNKIPKLQNEFAQGENEAGVLQWKGADQGEIFSWGPLVRTLEFDGSDYPFDKNGRLVLAGTGNGKEAKHYDPTEMFTTGFTTSNELTVTLPAAGGGTFVFNADNLNRSGIIPNTDYRKFNLSATVNDLRFSEKLYIRLSGSYNNSDGNLLNRGANLASIIGSIYRTPSTFDNANGLPEKQSVTSTESYQLPDGSVRSHAPGQADNPLGLINSLPDSESFERFIASSNIKFVSRKTTVQLNVGTDRQKSDNIFGIPIGYSGYTEGRLTDRKDVQEFDHAIASTEFRLNTSRGYFHVTPSYQIQYWQRELSRKDGFAFANESFGDFAEADSLLIIEKGLERLSHEIAINFKYNHQDWLTLKAAGRAYYSNTAASNLYTNFFPSFSFGFDLARLIGMNGPESIKFYGGISRSLREAPLLYSNWAYGSTRLEASAYNTFFESSELFFHEGLAPETERKIEAGLIVQHRDFNFEATTFNNHTNDFVAPIWKQNSYELQNVASIKNYGGAISMSYNRYFNNVYVGTDLKWSKYTSIADEVYTPDDLLPISGFESAQTVFAKGKPVGAIYGTSYMRNAEGKTVVGNDGFPIEDENLKMIGNPIPDWTLSWSAFLKWKELRLSFLFDFKRGGDVWNGTNAMLDYLGRSQSTADLRNVSQYVFDGVNESGTINTTPVDFYNPANPLSENRWVRYGSDGIGEDYIEDASWIRLNELSLSYSIKRFATNIGIKEIRFTLTGRNLFLITPYTGVDPSASLFGNSTANGIDLFNTPSTRSYTAQITIKI